MLAHFSPLQPLQNYLSPQPMNLSASLFIPFPNPVLTHHNCALPSSLRAPGWIIDGAWLSPSCPCCKAWHRAVGFLLSHTWTEEPQLALGMKVPNCLVSETVGGLLADCAYPHIIKYWGCHPWLLPARAWKVSSDSWFIALIRNSWCIFRWLPVKECPDWKQLSGLFDDYQTERTRNFYLYLCSSGKN